MKRMAGRRTRTLALALAVCLLVSACAGRGAPVPPLNQSTSAPQPAAMQGDPAPSSVSEAAEPDPAFAVSEADSSSAVLEPASQAAPEGSSSLPPEEPPSSQPEVEPPPLPPESQSGEEAPSQPEDPGEAEEPPPPEDGFEPLPAGCRWLEITEVSVLGFINRERCKKGLTPLTLDTDLTAAARRRAAEMYRGNYVRHTRPGGEPWETVLGEVPVDYARAAENLAWCNHGVGEEVGAFQWFTLWKESAEHWEAMMDVQYTSCGIAVLTGPYYDGEDQSYAVAIFCTY